MYRKYLSVHPCVHMCVHVCVSLGASVHMHLDHRAMTFIKTAGFPGNEEECDLALTFSVVSKKPDTGAKH